jgi:hypothetical protein
MSASLLIQKRYLVAKVLATLLSLVFAFLYSRELGIVNRSILIYVFTLSSLTWIILTSGSTLTLRKLRPSKESREFESFISLILVESLIGIVVLTIGLLIFSNYKTTIPNPLIALIYGYFLLSGFAMIMVEILITYLKYLFSGLIELIAVGIQVSLFFLIFKPLDFSTASKLLLSFNISYLIICFWMAKVILSSMGINLKITSPILFWRTTKGSHLLGVSLGVVDRLDRFIIAFYFPTGTLAQYSAMSSLISYFRFIPEFFSRIMISGFILPYSIYRKNRILVLSFFLVAVSSIVFISRIFISNFLGEEWLLPVTIFIAFGIQEILRGAYQISINYNSKLNLSFSTSFIPIILLCLTLILSSLAVDLFGLIGIPIAFSLSFVVCILLASLWRKSAK